MEPSAGEQSFSTPVKPATRSAVRSLLRSPPPSDEIATPEKPIELPRSARGKGVVYSLKQANRAAIGLQAPEQTPDEKLVLDGAGEGDDLPLAEEEQVFGSGGESVQRNVKPKASPKLPEKYEMLLQFFKCLLTSFRLLRLKGQACTFSNICPKIECLTDRRFSFVHLAQLKHIVPEAILVKKVLSHDENTCCMKPDLQINIDIDALGEYVKGKEESSYAILTKVFQTRLVEFSDEHPEGDEVPQDPLLEPFCHAKLNAPFLQTMDLHPNPSSTSALFVETSGATSHFNPASSSAPPAEGAASHQQFAVVPSHISMSFQRRFSQRSSTQQKSLLASSPSRLIQIVPSVSSKDTSLKEGTCEKATNVSTDDHPLGGTPAKLMSTPARIMTATPELKTPKRSRSSMNDDRTPAKKSVRRPLSLTPTKNVDSEDEKAETDDNESTLRFLPKSLLQSVREKERKAIEDREAGTSESKRRQKMIACLPKLFDLILLLFQSVQRSALTKQELICKIIASHFDIVDRSEVEEQLSLLQELLPDWISGKMMFSGDFMICMDKIASPELLRKKLAEAK